MYTIVVGGGNVGTQLAKRLISRENEVLLIEKNSEAARQLCAQLGSENVFTGDGCDLRIQKLAGFNRADVVLAVTGEDEDNFVVCQLAKTVWNTERVLARVNDPEHEEIFRRAGIDETVSATGIIFSLLSQQIAIDDFVPIGAINKGDFEIVQTLISLRSPLLGSKIRDLKLPPGTYIVYLIRDGEGMAVSGDIELQPDDTVIATVPRKNEELLRDFMLGKGLS